MFHEAYQDNSPFFGARGRCSGQVLHGYFVFRQNSPELFSKVFYRSVDEIILRKDSTKECYSRILENNFTITF